MTKSAGYMHSQGKREREPVLGAGEFFTAGTPAPATRHHRRKRGVRTSTRGYSYFLLTGPHCRAQLLEGSIPQPVIYRKRTLIPVLF